MRVRVNSTISGTWLLDTIIYFGYSEPMRRKLIRNISANTSQLVINQLFGLLIFYVLSNSLNKETFGNINLVLAILHTSFNILSCGIDQIAVRKIASGTDASKILSLYVAHVITAGLLFYILILGSSLLLPNVPIPYPLLMLIGIGKLMIFFSSPFKQAAMGLEKFNLLAYMSVVSNIIRGLALVILALANTLSLSSIVIIFICGDILELLVCVYLCKYRLKVPLKLQWNRGDYSGLIKEAFPQVGVVLFTSAIARFDWIFIGIFLSSVKLAEYSFAWKVFELSTLPLLAVAPLLLPLFTRLSTDRELHADKFYYFLRFEMIVASLVALVINVCWTPVIDFATSGKYGLVNTDTILILSLSMPFLYFNNFMWSIYFADGKLKFILFVIGITFAVNLVGDVFMIPILKNEGAALSYLLAMIVQFILYVWKTDLTNLKSMIYSLVLCSCSAFIAVPLARSIFTDTVHILLSSVLFFLAFLFICAQLSFRDVTRVKQLGSL